MATAETQCNKAFYGGCNASFSEDVYLKVHHVGFGDLLAEMQYNLHKYVVITV